MLTEEHEQPPHWKAYAADPRLNHRCFSTTVLRLMIVFLTIVVFWIGCIIISARNPDGRFSDMFNYIPHLSLGIFIIGAAWAAYTPARCPNCNKPLATETEPGEEYGKAGNEKLSISVSAPDSKWSVCHNCHLRSEKGTVITWRSN